MSFQQYVDHLMSDGTCRDAALVDLTGNKSVLASGPGGIFANITPEEVDVLAGPDRERLLADGVTIGGRKYLVIKDNLHEEDGTMDLKMKSEEIGNTVLAKAKTVLVLVIGKNDTTAGFISKKTFAMAEYLRLAGL